MSIECLVGNWEQLTHSVQYLCVIYVSRIRYRKYVYSEVRPETLVHISEDIPANTIYDYLNGVTLDARRRSLVKLFIKYTLSRALHARRTRTFTHIRWRLRSRSRT